MKHSRITKLMLVVAFIFSMSSFSVQESLTNGPGTGSAIDFVMMENNRLIFDIDLRDLPAEGVKFSIMDQDQNIIFEDYITKTAYAKRYKIERMNLEKIIFEVNRKGYRFIRSFHIKSKLEEKLEVVNAG